MFRWRRPLQAFLKNFVGWKAVRWWHGWKRRPGRPPITLLTRWSLTATASCVGPPALNTMILPWPTIGPHKPMVPFLGWQAHGPISGLAGPKKYKERNKKYYICLLIFILRYIIIIYIYIIKRRRSSTEDGQSSCVHRFFLGFEKPTFLVRSNLSR